MVPPDSKRGPRPWSDQLSICLYDEMVPPDCKFLKRRYSRKVGGCLGTSRPVVMGVVWETSSWVHPERTERRTDWTRFRRCQAGPINARLEKRQNVIHNIVPYSREPLCKDVPFFLRRLIRNIDLRWECLKLLPLDLGLGGVGWWGVGGLATVVVYARLCLAMVEWRYPRGGGGVGVQCSFRSAISQ